MSGRYSDYDKGSSRSTRDDSRTHRGREVGARDRRENRSRSRSRSPQRPSPSSSRRKHSSERSSSRSHSSRHRDYNDDKPTKRQQLHEMEEEEEVPEPPPPPRISKISIGFSKPQAPIKMSLNTAKPTAKPKPTVASVFNDDDDDEEPEEMPAEAKMRMRNIGRETPTSAGPNSFGKTKQGFCDAKKVFEKNLKSALEVDTQKPPLSFKFPQTIYKIKGP